MPLHFQVLMNIILFCRILSVDFSDIPRGKSSGSSSRSAEHHRKEEFTSTQKLNGSSTNWSHSGLGTYVKSMFDEETTEGKERKD
jgi:hypothetical protein